MEEQAWELDVGVAAAVDDRDAVALEDLPRFRRRISCDEQKMPVWTPLRPLDELPGGGRVGVPLDLDRDGLGRPGEPENGVDFPAAPSRLKGLDRDARHLT
jgi:hypothetical protein